MFDPRCAQETPVADVERRAREVLAQLGMETLAGVLVMNPRILVMDEPTAFLDPYGRRHVLEPIAHLKQTRLIVSHDLELVLEFCSRIIVISDGPTGVAIRAGCWETTPSLQNLIWRCRFPCDLFCVLKPHDGWRLISPFGFSAAPWNRSGGLRLVNCVGIQSCDGVLGSKSFVHGWI